LPQLNNPLTGILGNGEPLLSEIRRKSDGSLPQGAPQRLETITGNPASTPGICLRPRKAHLEMAAHALLRLGAFAVCFFTSHGSPGAKVSWNGSALLGFSAPSIAANLLFSTYGTPARLTPNTAAVFPPCTL
jgi:hypothetical protein